jgi:hypothetical protein
LAAGSPRPKRWKVVALVALAAIAAIAVTAYFLLRDDPVVYTDAADRYKYGSFGTEVDSMPFPIWEALPDVCQARLPGGWPSLGLIYEKGHDEPIGVSRRRVSGNDRMGVNCAMCHTGSVREAPGAPAQVVLGMPNQQLDFGKYVRFILDCVGDPAFTPDNVVAAMRTHHEVSGLRAFFYRQAVIPTVKRLTATKAPQFAWYADKPEPGPGRLDTPNSLKRMLGLAISADSVGTVEFPAVWNQSARGTKYRHWDANSPSLTERDHITAAIAGATEASVSRDELVWIETWLDQLPPPKYPFAIDRARAEQGAQLFAGHCATCHVQRALDITPVALVASDRSRLDALSDELVVRMNAFGSGLGGQSAHYRKTAGYSNVLLDGIWARGPYLHNGSVPSVLDLLTAPERRPAVFYTGSNVFDQTRMGFVSSGGNPDSGTFRFDTRLPGNGNGGHLYGTQLSDDEKRSLIEYLKTR